MKKTISDGNICRGRVNPLVNPFHATGLFQYLLKTTESLWFSDVFRGYRKKQVARNWIVVKGIARLDGFNF